MSYRWFNEARDRKIWQWTVGYMVAISAIIGFIATTNTIYYLPLPIVRAGITSLIFGIFIVITIAWHHGDKGRQEVSRGELSIIFATILACAATISTMEIYLYSNQEPNSYTIAILPFDFLDSNDNLESITLSSAEDIISQLSTFDSLRVIAPVSSSSYLGSNKDPVDIATELNAQYLLLGSIRLSGNDLFVSARIIEGQSGKVIWARTYRRPQHDLLSINRSIVIGVLETVLGHTPSSIYSSARHGRTYSMEAYDLLIRSRGLIRMMGNEPGAIQNAELLLKEAIEIDPNYGLAHALLSSVYLQKRIYHGENWYDSSLVSARRAINISPTLPEAYLSLGTAYAQEGQFTQADESLLKVIQISPSNTEAAYWLGVTHWHSSKIKEAIGWLRYSVKLDPNNWDNISFLASMYKNIGCIESFKRIIQSRRINDDEYAFYNSDMTGYFLSKGDMNNFDAYMDSVAIDAQDVPELWAHRAWTNFFNDRLDAAKLDVNRAFLTLPDWQHPNVLMAYFLKQDGDDQKSDSLLSAEEALALSWINDGDSGYRPYRSLAMINAVRGRNDKSVVYLKEGLRRGWIRLAEIEKNPIFNDIIHLEDIISLTDSIKHLLTRERLSLSPPCD